MRRKKPRHSRRRIRTWEALSAYERVVVWSGDPFELSTCAEHVLVRGVERTAPSRQDMLMQQYRTLPPDYRKP